VLAGAINYAGGFVAPVLTLVPARTVKYFRVLMPAGCPAQIVKAGVLSPVQSLQPTQLVDAQTATYSVNGGNGALLTGIQVTLNGGGFCQIGIYVQ